MLQKVSDLIIDVAREEDLILRRLGKGIFMMPELAFAHAVGRKIAMNKESIFGDTEVEWCPENRLSEASGITDLVFKNKSGQGLAIEFKMMGDSESYKQDILKLKKIPGGYEKMFCALIDAWPEALYTDSRIKAVEELGINDVHRICRDTFFDFFSPLSFYAKQISCVVGIWHVE